MYLYLLKKCILHIYHVYGITNYYHSYYREFCNQSYVFSVAAINCAINNNVSIMLQCI